MEYSHQSILFLHIAYVVIAVAQVIYISWIATRWLRTRRELGRDK